MSRYKATLKQIRLMGTKVEKNELTGMLFSKNAIEAPGLDGCVEQFARNISPTSYFPSSVTKFG